MRRADNFLEVCVLNFVLSRIFKNKVSVTVAVSVT